MKNKNIIITAIIILVLLISSVAGYFFFFRGGSDSILTIGELYGPDGNLIQKGLSVVGGVEGVKYITLKVNIDNKDTVPLTFSVRSLDPIEIDSKKPIGIIEIQPNERGSLKTDLIDIEPYEGSLQEFCVTIYSHKITALREEAEQSGCISVQIDPNPLGSFDISLESSVGDSAVNPGCTESWQCSEWNSCANLIQTRTCTELNNCGTTINKPAEQQVCETPAFQTNAVNGNYGAVGVWIMINGIPYYRGASSSYNCLPENVFMSTPEGNQICLRPGYDISQRVCMQYGTSGSLIFTP